jgi:GTP pyrophosphokinase
VSTAATTFAPVPGLSRTKIDRDGVVLRDWWIDEHADATDDVVRAFRTMIAFREAFQLPLNKTVMGLRSMVFSEWPELKEESSRIPVVQRLKRREQILYKLERFPETKLSNMADIGGCRAILPTREQVDGVIRRIKKNWVVHGRIRDTRDEPAPSGYRAVHVIVIRDGRRIEIQVRTPPEHEWAVAVERMGVRLGIPLKEGIGPEEVKTFFRLASHGMYLASVQRRPDSDFLVEFEEARQAMMRLLE